MALRVQAGDRRVAIDTENLMTATGNEFKLERKIVAYEGGETVFEKQQSETIGRGTL